MDKQDEAKMMLGKIKAVIAAREKLEQDRDDLERMAMGEEIYQKIVDIGAEYGDMLENLDKRRNELEKQVKELVIEIMATVKIDGAQAVYTPAGISWDTKALIGYAAARPELKEFQKPKDASVALRVK